MSTQTRAQLIIVTNNCSTKCIYRSFHRKIYLYTFSFIFDYVKYVIIKCMDQHCTMNTSSLRLFASLTFIFMVYHHIYISCTFFNNFITLMHFQLQVGFSRWNIDSMPGLHFVHVFRHSRPCCHLWRPLR